MYAKVLTIAADLGEWLNYVLCVGVALGGLYVLFTQNFENAAFSDGTGFSCSVDGDSGVVTHGH